MKSMINLPRRLGLSRLSLILLSLIVLLPVVFYIILLLGTTDCLWSGTAKAWIDLNQNGIWEAHEPPLSEVQFLIDDPRNDFINVGDKALSDETGEAQLHVWLPGCPRVDLEVYAVSPSGYDFTTQARIEAQSDEVFLFGFVKAE